MKKLYLHIGAEKTGSTFIQEVLSRNSKLIQLHNLYYCSSAFKYANHMELCSLGVDGDLLRNVEKPRKISDFKKLLRDEILNCSYDNIIMSNEHLSSRVVFSSQLESILSFLKSIVDCEIYIIFYYRDPFQWLQSQYKQYVRSGGFLKFNEYYYSTHPADCATLKYISSVNSWSTSELVNRLYLIDYDLHRTSILNVLLKGVFSQNFSINLDKTSSNDSLGDFMIYLLRCLHRVGINRRISRFISRFDRILSPDFSIFTNKDIALMDEFRKEQLYCLEQLKLDEKVTCL